jgi:hypothetical protein
MRDLKKHANFEYKELLKQEMEANLYKKSKNKKKKKKAKNKMNEGEVK